MKINNSTSYDLSELKTTVDEFYPYSKETLGFDRDPESLNFISDPENAQDMLGKTAYYDPDSFSITIYTDNRHPKDIMRSISHELVHHAQNMRGEFDDMDDLEEGYAQTNDRMRVMEEEAYKLGNIVFRDWEDKKKSNDDLQKEGIMNNIKKEMMATPDTTRDAMAGGEDDSLEMELFPSGTGDLQEDMGVTTIALGTALGILGTLGVGYIAGAAISILKDAGRKAQSRANNEMRAIEAEFQQQIADVLGNDPGFASLLKQYRELVAEVEEIKGQRGPEFQEIRQRRKDVSKELTKYIDSKTKDIFSQVDPGVRSKAKGYGDKFNYTSAFKGGVSQARNKSNLNEVRKMKKAKLEEMILEYCQTKNFKTLAEIRQVKAIAEKIIKENKDKGEVANLYEEPVTEEDQLEEEDSVEEGFVGQNGMEDGDDLNEEDELYEEDELEEISKPTGPKSRGRDEPDRRHRMENRKVPAKKSAKRINESKYDKKFKDLIEKWCK